MGKARFQWHTDKNLRPLCVSRYSRRDCQASIMDFVKGCQQYGIQFTMTQPFILHAGNCEANQVFNHIKAAAKEAGYNAQQPPQLVVTYVSKDSAFTQDQLKRLLIVKLINKTSRQYAQIKNVCDTKFGVASQNLTIQKAKSAKSQYYSNVALKVNVKLAGGINQTIARPLRLPGLDRPTIIFGAEYALIHGQCCILADLITLSASLTLVQALCSPQSLA